MMNEAHVGGGRSIRKGARWQFVVVLVAILIVALGAGAATRWIFGRNNKANTPTESPRLPAQIRDIQNFRMTGDATDAAKKIDEGLADPHASDEAKYMLYIQKGNLETDAQNWQAAIDVYLKADHVKKTVAVAELLAEAYRSAGNKSRAIYYYQQAISRIPANSPTGDTDKQAYQLRLQDLESQP